jgi:hypothetical protein
MSNLTKEDAEREVVERMKRARLRNEQLLRQRAGGAPDRQPVEKTPTSRVGLAPVSPGINAAVVCPVVELRPEQTVVEETHGQNMKEVKVGRSPGGEDGRAEHGELYSMNDNRRDSDGEKSSSVISLVSSSYELYDREMARPGILKVRLSFTILQNFMEDIKKFQSLDLFEDDQVRFFLFKKIHWERLKKLFQRYRKGRVAF